MTVIDLECVTRGYVKASKENIDKVAAPFQADPRKIELLSILDEQVELLAKEGRPELSRFLDSLESYSITPLEEVSHKRDFSHECSNRTHKAYIIYNIIPYFLWCPN